jgi:hypothetical protein
MNFKNNNFFESFDQNFDPSAIINTGIKSVKDIGIKGKTDITLNSKVFQITGNFDDIR